MMDDSSIICNEVIESNRKAKSYDETNFNEKKTTCLLYFTCIFINYYSIVDSC